MNLTREQIAEVWPPLRQYWRDCNRYDRAVAAWQRTQRKAHDQKRAKCRCEAYAFPHRPGGGYCRHPDPPAVRWKERRAVEVEARIAEFRATFGEPTPVQLVELAKSHRPYRKRYVGLLRQIARANGMHPIHDRAAIEELMPRVLAQAKAVKRRYPRVKYRNMEITENCVRGQWQTAGPMM